MKTFTLCLKIFTFLILTWIFHCFYNHNSSSSFINKDTFKINNRLKYQRLLAETDVLEKKQIHIKERKEYYPSGEKDNKDENLVNFKNIYIMLYSALFLSIYELFSKRTNYMSKECYLQSLVFYRKNISYERHLEELLI
ncbi:fam-g protein [Plasmodium gallinaceum]|uniref:Fam-g protein n=1 Tax=Plasmodium gallinaceum TaxID=5849 RepID=A0A1J1GYG0_PLAGA|nr:fam-g protein [Plasmodium gallinaceum]CRG96048.1 fam-g protein [Plasmodium gallinaceum]